MISASLQVNQVSIGPDGSIHTGPKFDLNDYVRSDGPTDGSLERGAEYQQITPRISKQSLLSSL